MLSNTFLARATSFSDLQKADMTKTVEPSSWKRTIVVYGKPSRWLTDAVPTLAAFPSIVTFSNFVSFGHEVKSLENLP